MKEQVSLIIAAMDCEVEALLNILHRYETIELDGRKAYRFTLNNEKYILCKGLIGKANTAFLLGRLTALLDVKRVFNIGTSGGVNKDLKINDVIVATKVGYHDADARLFNYELGQIPGEDRYFECDNEYISKHPIDSKYSIKRGIVLSGDSFMHKDNVEGSFLTEDSCMCAEMESGTVGQICHKLGIPFIVVRSISDMIFKGIDTSRGDTDFISSSTNSALILYELIK